MAVGHAFRSSGYCSCLLILCIVYFLAVSIYLPKRVLETRSCQDKINETYYWEKSGPQLFRLVRRQRSCCRGRTFLSSRVRHSTGGQSWFNIQRLTLSGDIHLNPGPIKFPSKECGKSVRSNQNAILCSDCGLWILENASVRQTLLLNTSLTDQLSIVHALCALCCH